MSSPASTAGWIPCRQPSSRSSFPTWSPGSRGASGSPRLTTGPWSLYHVDPALLRSGSPARLQPVLHPLPPPRPPGRIPPGQRRGLRHSLPPPAASPAGLPGLGRGRRVVAPRRGPRRRDPFPACFSGINAGGNGQGRHRGPRFLGGVTKVSPEGRSPGKELPGCAGLGAGLAKALRLGARLLAIINPASATPALKRIAPTVRMPTSSGLMADRVKPV